MLDAVIFDIDNTLYDYDAINGKAIECAGRWLCGHAGVSLSDYYAAFRQGRENAKKHIGDRAARHNRLIYFQRTSEVLGLNPIEYSLELYEKYWGYMLDNMVLAEGALELITYLKGNGAKIGICTDLTSHIQHRKLRELKIAQYVDAFVSSEEADAEKPDKAIFNLILEKLDASPGETMYVGDSYEKDVLGAQNAGMFPVWYNPKGKGATGPGNASFLEVRRFRQLQKYINGEMGTAQNTRGDAYGTAKQ